MTQVQVALSDFEYAMLENIAIKQGISVERLLARMTQETLGTNKEQTNE